MWAIRLVHNVASDLVFAAITSAFRTRAENEAPLQEQDATLGDGAASFNRSQRVTAEG